MKRKMALLLASIMSVASLPINIFAQDTTPAFTGTPAITRLSRSVVLAPNRTAFVEEGAGSSGSTSGEVSNSDRVEHWIEGGNLNVIFEADYQSNRPIQFTLELDNAEWFFRNAGEAETGNLGFSTFNAANGTWSPSNNTYTRTATDGGRAYSMQVSSDPRRATVTLLPGGNGDNTRSITNQGVSIVDTDNNTVDNNGTDNEVVATVANVKPESKATENKVKEIKTPETKTPETKTPETKVPETKVPETKVPETKTPEIKAPENKTNGEAKTGNETPAKVDKTKEKVGTEKPNEEEQDKKVKENKLPISIKPADETPAKEAPKAPDAEAPKPVTEEKTKTPENKLPKATAVAVANIPVDAMSPYDDITLNGNGNGNGNDNGNGNGNDNGNDDNTDNLLSARSNVDLARNYISSANTAATGADANVGSVRTPVQNAQNAVYQAQQDLNDVTSPGTVDANLTTAHTQLGTTLDALDDMVTTDDTDEFQVSGTNYDAFRGAIDTALNSINTAYTALDDAVPAPPGDPNPGPGNGGYGVRDGEFVTIPLIVRTTGENVDASVRVTQAYPVPIETNRRVFAQATQQGLTTTVVSNPRTGRDRIEIPSIGVLENRIGAFPQSGTFEIAAPSGYHFASLPNDATLRVEGGIGEGTNWTSNIELRNNATVARITYNNLVRSTRLTGSFAITGLTLVASNPDSIREGDVYLQIRNVGTPAVVTAQRFLAGTVSDWRVSMSVVGDAPQLINGRLDGVERTDINDQSHRAATVRVEENVENAWWAQRTTTFTLPEQVRVRKVEFSNIRNISNYDTLQGSFYNDRNRSGSASVRVNDNVITLTNLQTHNSARASFEMDLWLNIESGFNGEIPLTLSGSAINNGDTEHRVVIASAIDPVKLDVDVTNVRIGYQFVPVGNFSIIETVPGALKYGEQVFLTITDNTTNDVSIASGFNWDVVKGDLRIRSMRTGSNLSLNNNNNRNNENVSFEIDRESTEASEIEFSNVQVRLGGNVSGINGHDYDLVAWGPAIAANFEGVRPDDDSRVREDGENGNYRDVINRNDFFREAGIRAKYVSVQNISNNALRNIVRVTSGSPIIRVNDEEMAMDTAPYVSPRSDSMMVPVRFISMGLGVDANRVLWSPDTSTVTIDAGERILQFQTNSSIMRINGIEIPMLNANGQPVYSEVRDERAFIPFRALGEALNVHVSWEPSTATATFDPTRTPERGQSLNFENENLAHYGNYNNNQNGASGYTNGNQNEPNGYTNGDQNGANGYTNGNQSGANGYTNGNQNGANGYTNGNENGANGYTNGNENDTNGYTNGINRYSNGYNNMNQQDDGYQGMQIRSRGILNRAGRVQTRTPVNYNTNINR